MRGARVAAALAALGALGPLGVRTAGAQGFANNDFALEVHEGSVHSSTRTVGLAGAYTAIAEGIEGLYYNPAAVANRPTYALSRFDYDVDLSVSFPVFDLLGDFDLNGRQANSYQSYYGLSAGFAFRAGLVGAGIDVLWKSYEITVDQAGVQARLPLTTANGRAALGYGFLNDQLVIGIGGRLTSLEVPAAALRFNGAAGEIGVLVRPEALPLRAAATVRTAASTQGRLNDVPIDCAGTTVAMSAGRVLPCELRQPWEIELGAAVSLGPKPFNPRWFSPGLHLRELREQVRAVRTQRQSDHEQAMALLPPFEREAAQSRWNAKETRLRHDEARYVAREMRGHNHARERWYRSIQRSYVLLSASVLIVGPSPNAFGMESFLDPTQTPQPTGQSSTVSVRLGLEAEPIRDRLAVRAGSYLEPSRFEGVDPRVHVTAGFDVRFLRWDFFGLLSEAVALHAGLVADFGFPNYYQYFALSLGTWH